MNKSRMNMVVLGSLVFLYFSCKEIPTLPNQSPISFSSQYSKCLSQGLPKISVLDSIFTYSFSDNLITDFSVIANCCPGSNRFSVSSLGGTDTLVVAVADTAQGLCDCVCLYMVHAEFNNLPNDHYVVRCTYGNLTGYHETIHLVRVNRGT